jgi:hypothetical protein
MLRNQLQLGCSFNVLQTLMSVDDEYLTKEREKYLKFCVAGLTSQQ